MAKKINEYGDFLDLVDAAVHTSHEEVNAEIDKEKRAKQQKKRAKKRPASARDSDAKD